MQTVEIAPGRRIRVQSGPPCPHLGEPTGRNAEWNASEDRTVLLRLYSCAVHGTCTPQQRIAGHACCNGCPDRPRTDPAGLEWVRTADLIRDAIRLAAMVPPDVSGVAGIPRSGMIPASVIATHLHLPLYELTPEGELRRLGAGGRGRRGFGGSAEGPILVVDDTVYAGHAMRRARAAIEKLNRQAIYAAVYVREQPLPESRGVVDLWGRILPSPHLLEWNVCNNGPLIGRAQNPVYRKGVGLDLDGVILHDKESGGKPGGAYLLPRTHPAPLIATGRHERHRATTEAQLRAQGVQWQRLEMLPNDVPQTDEAIAAHKAKHFVAADLGFFVESDPEQARQIAAIAGRPVICPREGRVFQPAAKQAAGIVVPQPPPLDLKPRSRRAVVTVAVGPEALACLAASRGHMEAYASRVGADFVVLNWPGHPDWPLSSKFAIARVLDHYDRIAYVDADVLLRPGCVDLFSLCDEDEFGWCDEMPWYAYRPFSNRYQEYQEFRRTMGFREIPHLPWMGNAGVMVIPAKYRDLLLPPAGPIPPGHCAEQDHTNAKVLDGYLDGKVKVRLLDRRANWQVWTDSDFRSATPDAVLHWSGHTPSRKRRAEQIREWATAHPVPVCIIASSHRSGSSLLALALADAGVGNPQEWFCDNATAEDGLARMKSESISGGWIAAKIHGSQLKDCGLADRLRQEFPQAKYIALQRRDRVRQAISLVRARQTGNYSSRDAAVVEPQYDREHIEHCLRWLAEQNEAWEGYFSSQGIEPFRVVYEDLVADWSKTIRSVAGYLGVEIASVPLPQLAQQADVITEEWVKKFLGQQA